MVVLPHVETALIMCKSRFPVPTFRSIVGPKLHYATSVTDPPEIPVFSAEEVTAESAPVRSRAPTSTTSSN
jgi:hypothetical protein